MKLLCVCERGNCRSVACAFWLRKRGYECIAFGAMNSSEETRQMLCEWADTIILTTKQITLDDWPKTEAPFLRDHIPVKFWPKVKIWDLGPDTYFNWWKGDILARLERFYIKEYE